MIYEDPVEQKKAHGNNAKNNFRERKDLKHEEEEYWVTHEEVDDRKESYENAAADHSGKSNDHEPKEKEHWESHKGNDGYEKTHKEDSSSQFEERYAIKIKEE